VNPLVLIVGRVSPEAKNVRGEPFAAGRRYFHAAARAGGTPLMLPPILDLVDDVPDLMRRIDAVVLHGGGDVDPRHYGQPATAEQLYGIVEEHDEVELAVVRAALELDVPMLAICRGMQVLNVAMGGTLQQHIGSEDHWFEYTHVELEPGSRIAKAIGNVNVASCHCVHHQALDVVADGLHVTGHTHDGIVHAAEVPAASWIVACQWHPEDSADTDPQQQALFNALLHHT
jgi:putative glutamine amidotransferase